LLAERVKLGLAELGIGGFDNDPERGLQGGVEELEKS